MLLSKVLVAYPDSQVRSTFSYTGVSGVNANIIIIIYRFYICARLWNQQTRELMLSLPCLPRCQSEGDQLRCQILNH